MPTPASSAPADRKRTIAGTYFRRFMLISSLTLVLLGATWLVSSQLAFNEQARQSRDELLIEKTRLIQARAREAVAFINFTNNSITTRIRTEIRERVRQAHAMAESLHQRLGRDSAPAIRAALRSMRYGNDSGYFFAIGMDGVAQVIPGREELEGTDINDMRDDKDTPFIQTAIRIASTTGHGYYEYEFTKPGSPGDTHQKISYLMYFEPLDWYIGTGLYVDDVTPVAQKEVLEWLQTRGYVDGGYIFAGTYEGIPVLGPFKGQNVIDVPDANGKLIVRELIAAAKRGGDVVSYVLPSYDGAPAYPKISYALGIDEWGWYVGSGIPTDAMEKQLKAMREAHAANQIRVTLGILAALALCLLIQAWETRNASRRIGADFASFRSFFDRARGQARLIDRSRLHLEEFDTLAEAANDMIRERSAMEGALRESENRYRGIFENIVDGYYRSDMQGNLQLVSPSARQLGGWDEDMDITTINLGRDVYQDIDDRNAFRETILREGRIDGFSTTIRRANGELLEVEINSHLILDEESGEPVAVEGIIRDITERKRTQELLVQTEKMMSVGGLAAGMAHEINNPLGGILQGVQNVERRLSPELPANVEAAEKRGITLEAILGYLEDRRIMHMIEGIRSSGERAAQIVRGMLNFSRNMESSCTPCDINDLADHAVELASSDYDLSKKYDFRNVIIDRDYAPDLPLTPCTITEIEQVLLNLLRNAAQAMSTEPVPDGGHRILIRTSRQGEHILIEVRDNGPGMDETTRKRIFEPFFTTKPPGVGTGLGLSVSYFIITQNHDGEFSVESEPGHGTAFFIRLPVQRASGPRKPSWE